MGTKKRKGLASARADGIQKVMGGTTNGVSNQYCAWANNLRRAVERELFGVFGHMECAGGGRTKYIRLLPGLPEAHHCGALCVGAVPQTCRIDQTNGYCPSAGTAGHGTRYRSSHNTCGIITWKTEGRTPKRRFVFQNGDIVRAVIPPVKYQGIHTCRVMTRAGGYFSIRTLDSRITEAKHTLFTRLQPYNGCQYTVHKV